MPKKTWTIAGLLALLAPLPAAAEPDGLAPLPPEEWTLETAAHLLRRAGFGGTPEEIAALHALGPDGAVDRLLDWSGGDPRVPAPPITLTDQPGRDAMTGKTEEERQMVRRRHRQADLRQFAEIREWWMRAMVTSAHPLRERLVLFWHGHFTSSQRDVRNSYHLWIQHTLFRREAAGSFRTLLHEISKDPAMLEYLDNNRNRKGQPNENYAREVMELFTMGAGNYTEDDVKEAARAFTGWSFEGNRFVFHRNQHDDGEKTFLGRKGRFDGAAVLDVILEQEATSRHVAAKLFRTFAHDDPDPAVVEGLARTLRRGDYELKPLLRQLLRSRAFHAAPGTRISGPVELLVTLHRSLGMEPGRGLSLMAQGLGQALLDPPNVKGWAGGRDWITTSHLLNRYNVCGALVGLPEDKLRAMGARGGRGGRRVDPNGEEMEGEGGMGMEGEDEAPPPPRFRARRLEARMPSYDVLGEVRRKGLASPEAVVDHFTRTLLAAPPPGAMRATLLAHLGPFRPDAADARERLHGLLRLIVSTPEFQLS